MDKLFKRGVRGGKPKVKHDQDIPNLRLITNAEEVNIKLEKYEQKVRFLNY